MIKLYTNSQIRALEQRCLSENHLSEQALMANAGQAAFQALQRQWPQAKRIAVFCGKGNNAGDGFILAQQAKQAGLNVSVFTTSNIEDLSPTAKWAAELCISAGVSLTPYHSALSIEADVIVDALLGSGLKGEVRTPFKEIIVHINSLEIPVLALDVPSGLDVDSGCRLGVAIKATVTINFIGLKQGLYTSKGPVECGQIEVDALKIPTSLIEASDHSSELMNWDAARSLLPRRSKDTHKGKNGHVLVIGGDYGMGGAVRLASEAAMRVGSGLVTVATRPEHVTIVSGTRPEIMCHQVTCKEDLLPLLERATVVAIGPGLGKGEWGRELLQAVIESQLPMVLDADGLNILSEQPLTHEQWVLTPHPGEAGRLLGISNKDIQADRFAAIDRITEKYHGVCVLKGAGTLVKTQCESHGWVCPAGNPGMATGGMGDILSGVIAGLAAQGLSLAKAAEIGVLVHSVAGDMAAEKGGERGLLATDLINFLRELVNP